MLRGFYTAATGMISNRTRMDVITNNLTNLDTVGYKKDNVLSRSFNDMLLSRMTDTSVLTRRANVIGGHNLGVYIDELSTDFSQGMIEATGLQTDLAIQGNGFFAVYTPEGIRYTRAGNFSVDANGYLVNNNGYLVLDTNMQAIPVGFGDFAVNAAGQVSNAGGAIAQLAVVSFNDMNGLRKSGENLFYHENGEVPTASTNFSVTQGALEGSNVDLSAEVVEMIVCNRAYEANFKSAQMIDQSLDKTVNDIAKF